ncbi:DUF2125 domain-containing protein [Breoghania sp. L-A4]|uniref:DUF2125 domain-containing protein n=1 Tax=Breoghania sp. L-A4 TaxID=2304600 RepID=UPI000E358C5E|nr:DUF2125 domain-containing protein [Breoghania sp. L-A4]AXS38755.1 DUF2125 domain-containing protein [Breoghania sp. L-A4]
MKRRFLVLAALVVLAAVGWSGFWWFAADRVALFLDDRIEQARGGDIAISCPGRQIEGWPFRMEVSCPRLGLTNANGRIESGPVRAVALAYDPRHVILEADGPIDLRDSVSGIGLSARWATARASLRMREGRLAAAAVSTQTPTATLSGLPLDNGGSQRLAARQMEVHMRHSPRDTAPDGADLALTIDGLALEGALVTDSPLDGALLLHVRDAASLLGATWTASSAKCAPAAGRSPWRRRNSRSAAPGSRRAAH